MTDATSTATDRLPVTTIAEAIPYLRRPFMPEAIKFKIQSVFKDAKGCLVVAYIDARLVSDRLNSVLPDRWSARYEPVAGQPNLMWCHLTLGFPGDVFGESITRSDIGEGQGATEGMRAKAAVSDSLKRAAVHFGIGVSVYALPQIKLWATQEHVEVARGAGGKPTLKLTEHGHVKLREGYSTWLETKNRFGAPLDHGDVEGATFDDEPVGPTDLSAGEGSGAAQGIVLPPEVEAIIARAVTLGHARLADRGQAEVAVGGRPSDVVLAWVAQSAQDLRDFQKRQTTEPEEATVVDAEPSPSLDAPPATAGDNAISPAGDQQSSPAAAEDSDLMQQMEASVQLDRWKKLLNQRDDPTLTPEARMQIDDEVEYVEGLIRDLGYGDRLEPSEGVDG